VGEVSPDGQNALFLQTPEEVYPSAAVAVVAAVAELPT